ncbi:MAG: hypothetical protein AB7E85_00215 [Pseudobdellovibrionaceae bacterium]
MLNRGNRLAKAWGFFRLFLLCVLAVCILPTPSSAMECLRRPPLSEAIKNSDVIVKVFVDHQKSKSPLVVERIYKDNSKSLKEGQRVSASEAGALFSGFNYEDGEEWFIYGNKTERAFIKNACGPSFLTPDYLIHHFGETSKTEYYLKNGYLVFTGKLLDTSDDQFQFRIEKLLGGGYEKAEISIIFKDPKCSKNFEKDKEYFVIAGSNNIPTAPKFLGQCTNYSPYPTDLEKTLNGLNPRSSLWHSLSQQIMKFF